jgi:hypothetical protein
MSIHHSFIIAASVDINPTAWQHDPGPWRHVTRG